MKRGSQWFVLVGTLIVMGCGSRPVGSSGDGGEGDADQNNNTSCLNGTCSGCCDPDGRCLSGTSGEACGVEGDECADCLALSGTCNGGICEGAATCGPENCPGCCDVEGRCVSGTALETCGADGNACSVCDGECIEGHCCRDQDEDGYGEWCLLGADCDDLAPGIVGACDQNGCPQGWSFVPSGTFIAGCLEGYDYPCGAYAVDETTMQLEGFCIETTETTVEAYRSCQSEGVCPEPDDSPPLGSGCNWSEDWQSDRVDHPINCVEWPRAQDFCRQWMGGDFPTEWQWEKAARGEDGRYFPWGNSPLPNDCSRCNYYYQDCLSNEDVYTWPAGHLIGVEGDSPYGVKDMCGNLLEYTRSCQNEVGDICDYDSDGDVAVARGGDSGFPWSDFDSLHPTKFSTYYRNAVAPFLEGSSWQIWGFRCARAPWAGQPSPAQP